MVGSSVGTIKLLYLKSVIFMIMITAAHDYCLLQACEVAPQGVVAHHEGATHEVA